LLHSSLQLGRSRLHLSLAMDASAYSPYFVISHRVSWLPIWPALASAALTSRPLCSWVRCTLFTLFSHFTCTFRTYEHTLGRLECAHCAGVLRAAVCFLDCCVERCVLRVLLQAGQQWANVSRSALFPTSSLWYEHRRSCARQSFARCSGIARHL
jgi:hypothetical protein